MKTNYIRKVILKFIGGLIFFTSNVVIAGGNELGNGGDICENRIKIIRDDIESWISKGGSNGLKLPKGLLTSQYNLKMREAIIKTQVSCTNDKIIISKAEKTCMNIIDDNNIAQIKCNASRFQLTSDSDQYVLIHHEYAGISGLEVNNGASSNYSISNQITGYLENQLVKKLAVKPRLSMSVHSGHIYIMSELPGLCGIKIEAFPEDSILTVSAVNNPINGLLCEPNFDLSGGFTTYKCEDKVCISLNAIDHFYRKIELNSSGNITMIQMSVCDKKAGKIRCLNEFGHAYWIATKHTEVPYPSLFLDYRRSIDSDCKDEAKVNEIYNLTKENALTKCSVYSNNCVIDMSLSKIDRSNCEFRAYARGN